MKKPAAFGIIIGILVSSTMAVAQSGTSNSPNRDRSPLLVRKLEKPAQKKSLKNGAAKSALPKQKGVAGAPASKPFDFKPLYAQNSISGLKVATATDANSGSGSTSGSGPTSPTNEKLMVNPPLVSSPATTSTSSLDNATKSAKKSPFSFKYRSYNAMNLNTVENPTNTDPGMDHEVQAWDRFNFSYNMTDNISVSLMPQIFHTWFGDRDRSQSSSTIGLDQPYAFYMGDTGLYLIDSKLAQFAGLTLDGSQAYFFSTSEASIKSGTIGQTRSSLGLGRSFGPIDIKWTESYWYYMQQYQTSTLFNTSQGEPLQNLNYQVWSLLDIGWNVSKKFSINLESGFMNQATLPDDNPSTLRNPVLDDYVILDPEIDYSFNDHFTLGLGIWEQYDMRAQDTVVTTGPAGTGNPVAWLPQYYPFDYRNGSQVYLQTTLKF